jgi:CIC family chloride channel protein
VSVLSGVLDSISLRYPILRRYNAIFREDLSATYSRDIQKWLLVAPIIGVVVGLLITLLTTILLDTIWVTVLPIYLEHHWTIVPGLAIGFFLTGLIMQYRTPAPNEHSSEEIIRSYHEHQGDIDMKPFWWELLAAITTVGSGGSAALEGPSIYGGGAIGSWLWGKLERFGLDSRDRRLMLISGAGAGMAAVFRAPLTGLVFALEMPYKDDLAHEALLPSLIASVVSYATLASIIGSQPLFGFASSTTFRTADISWSAALGLTCGLIAMVFTITFRRVRTFAIHAPIPHTRKLVIGGVFPGICGLIFVIVYPGPLIPLGPNYEAVRFWRAHIPPASCSSSLS